MNGSVGDAGRPMSYVLLSVVGIAEDDRDGLRERMGGAAAGGDDESAGFSADGGDCRTEDRNGAWSVRTCRLVGRCNDARRGGMISVALCVPWSDGRLCCSRTSCVSRGDGKRDRRCVDRARISALEYAAGPIDIR